MDGLSPVPDEPVDPSMLGLRIDAMGFQTWGQLYNHRQQAALLTFSNLIKVAFDEMILAGIEKPYAEVISQYLALAIDRLAVRNSNQCIYNATGEKVENEIARGVLPPVWDYVEAAPLSDSTGSWSTCLSGIVHAIEAFVVSTTVPRVLVRDATQPDSLGAGPIGVVTDPPYYNAVDYAGLSDFFYVWLKRSLGPISSHLFGLPLAPKRRQAIMDSESEGNKESRDRYVKLMRSAFGNVQAVVPHDQVSGVAFASISPEAWSTLIESLLDAGLVPQTSWPIDTEMQSGMTKIGQARLRTSVWMACRKREGHATGAFLSDVMDDMRPVIRERLLYFWGKGIRGADFFISAIGPALSVFGRHAQVLRPDGSEVSVRDFLDIVRRESTAVALEQVLQGADLGQVDPITRQYVTWVWSYSRAPLDAGEAIALCLATGATYDEMTRPHSIAAEARAKSKKVVKLRTIRERAMDDEDMGNGSPARPTPLVDQLQHAAWLWGQNMTDRLALYRGELGESRWSALRTLGQAVAECLPDGDEDRRIILGLLGSSVMATPPSEQPARHAPMLPGFEQGG